MKFLVVLLAVALFAFSVDARPRRGGDRDGRRRGGNRESSESESLESVESSESREREVGLCAITTATGEERRNCPENFTCNEHVSSSEVSLSFCDSEDGQTLFDVAAFLAEAAERSCSEERPCREDKNCTSFTFDGVEISRCLAADEQLSFRDFRGCNGRTGGRRESHSSESAEDSTESAEDVTESAEVTEAPVQEP